MADYIEVPKKYTDELSRAREAEDPIAEAAAEDKIRSFGYNGENEGALAYESGEAVIKGLASEGTFAELNNVHLKNPSSKRHILINAFADSNWDILSPLKTASYTTQHRRFITVTASDSNTVLDLDNVVQVTDLATLGTLGWNAPPTVSYGQDSFTLYYDDGGYTSEETDIRVQWNSGVIKTFRVLVPGIHQAIKTTQGSTIQDNIPGAHGCGLNYFANLEQHDLASNAQSLTKLYFSVKTHELDPNSLYTDVVGYAHNTQVEDPVQSQSNGYSTFHDVHISYDVASVNSPYVNFPQQHALEQAHYNYSLLGYDWDVVNGGACSNLSVGHSVSNGVDPTTNGEQLHRTITVVATTYYSSSPGSSEAQWNAYAVDAAASGDLNYANVKYALEAGTPGPSHFHQGLGTVVSAFPGSFYTSSGSSLPTMTTIEYADNLDCCQSSSTPTTYVVCDNASSPDYYLNTGSTNYGFDCNGVTIPAGALNGTIQANFVSGPSNCCSTDCTSTGFDNGMSFSNTLTTFGTANGTVTVTMDPSSTPTAQGLGTGTPWTSGSQYLFTLTHPTLTLTQTAPGAGGTTFDIANCTTAVSANATGTHVTIASGQISDRISPGMQVSGTGIPSNTFVGSILTGQIGADSTAGVAKFQLVDAYGAAVFSIASGTNIFTFASGREHVWGSLVADPQFYSACITDSAGCSFCQKVTVISNPPTDGCTDSGALNYDATATNDDGTCLTCNSVNGKAENALNSISLDFLSTASSVQTPVTNYATSNNDGILAITSSINTLLAGSIVLGTSTYTLTLYSFSSWADATTNTSGTQVAQQTGITLANGPNHTFTGLAAGYYGCKIEIEDSATSSPPGDDIKLEPCWGWTAEKVQAEVCTDPAASNQNTTLAADLQYSQVYLCTYPCNTSSTASLSFPNSCSPVIDLSVIATQGIPAFNALYPNGTEVGIVWSFNGNVIAGATDVTNGYVNSINYNTALTSNYITQDGLYSWEITTIHPSGISCQNSGSISVTLPICGCTDPLAINYNSSAVIDDGSCIPESYNCVNYICTDPMDGSGQYPTNAACQPQCIPPTGGCTDPCANNYDATASFDDGSCEYLACTDPTASNYAWSCSCNQTMVSVANNILSDPNCCTYPCGTVGAAGNYSTATVVITTTDSTGTCTSPLPDGTVMVNAVIDPTVATTYTVTYWNNSQTAIVYADPTIYSSGANSTLYTTLLPGVYFAEFLYGNGCSTIEQFIIGTTILTQGCTDPNADNYDPSAQCDDGSCAFCGCMDPLANNYLAGANCDDGSCIYTFPVNPCILEKRERERVLAKTTECITKRGETYLNKMRTGLIDDCSIMNTWKVILIKYLLESHGGELECLYNCAGAPLVAAGEEDDRCTTAWNDGGPSTGLNHAGIAGSIQGSDGGTIVTDPSLFFVVSNTIYLNDWIQMPSGKIWQIAAPTILATFGGYNPETPQGQGSGHWAECKQSPFTSINSIIASNAVNYLDNFINFVNKFCADCNTNF